MGELGREIRRYTEVEEPPIPEKVEVPDEVEEVEPRETEKEEEKVPV